MSCQETVKCWLGSTLSLQKICFFNQWHQFSYKGALISPCPHPYRYASQAQTRVKVPVGGAALSRAEADLAQWRRVVALYTLRLALAPLIETLVLLDRVLYVLEHGKPAARYEDCNTLQTSALLSNTNDLRSGAGGPKRENPKKKGAKFTRPFCRTQCPRVQLIGKKVPFQKTVNLVF